ncbi:MAG: M23 family metallopeptidase [Lachnospiraceae bacterium]|nr:M23 family metallopeptidase [Lachnospiraceae bacterium]
MVNQRYTHGYRKLVSQLTILVTGFLVFLFVQGIEPCKSTGDNFYEVTLNGEFVGSLKNPQQIEKALIEARKSLAKTSKELILADADVQYTGKEVVYGKIDSLKTVENRMVNVLKKNVLKTAKRAYTVKINEYTINLQSSEEVVRLLEEAKNQYDLSDEYAVELVLDPTRELNVLTGKILKKEELKEQENESVLLEAGIAKELTEITEEAGDSAKVQLGLKDINFGDKVEVVESYLEPQEISSLENAIDEVTKEQEKQQIYEVASGDTLSQISEKTEIPMEKLIEMNASIEDENSMIRAGDELIITVPEPELSVELMQEMYYEENYEASVQYVDNDEWYTTDMETLQDPVAGFRKVVADVSYRNDTETNREIVKEEIVMDAVPKIVERGTKVPPTYIKPISGGRLSSPFGKRSAPKKGASTYHKGVDWATPVGTAVMASSSGTVARAGWGSGYGYVVYINHADGRQTRYGHLSKILVKAGQKITQGDKIALSGNTGRSTGPHLHFEILVGGSQVNPLKYLN